MTYTVRYRRKGSFFWRTVKCVKGDLLPQDLPGFRVLIREDESRLEIPIDGTEFEFCARRFLVIRQKMEQEAGQKLPIG